MKKHLKAMLCVGLLFPGLAMAASDGTPGATSTGTSAISVTIPKLVRITSMADAAFGTYAGTGDLNDNDDVNIRKNYTGTYQITGTGSGAGSAFTLSDGGTQTLAYNVYFNDATGTTGEVQLTAGTALTGQSGATTSLGTATLNANRHVEILEASLQAVTAATFNGTLTLVVAPE